MAGSLSGVGAAALVTNLFDAQTLGDWAWRLPFFGGALLGIAAILIRRNLHTSEHFRQHHDARDRTSPLLSAFTTNRREMLLALAFAAAYGTCFYIAFVFLPEWLSSQGLMDRGTALAINTGLTFLVIPLMPLAAIVGDRIVPRKTWIALALLVLATAVPDWLVDSACLGQKGVEATAMTPGKSLLSGLSCTGGTEPIGSPA